MNTWARKGFIFLYLLFIVYLILYNKIIFRNNKTDCNVHISLYFKMAVLIKLSSKWILLKILQYTDVSAPSTLYDPFCYEIRTLFRGNFVAYWLI